MLASTSEQVIQVPETFSGRVKSPVTIALESQQTIQCADIELNFKAENAYPGIFVFGNPFFRGQPKPENGLKVTERYLKDGIVYTIKQSPQGSVDPLEVMTTIYVDSPAIHPVAHATLIVWRDSKGSRFMTIDDRLKENGTYTGVFDVPTEIKDKKINEETYESKMEVLTRLLDGLDEVRHKNAVRIALQEVGRMTKAFGMQESSNLLSGTIIDELIKILTPPSEKGAPSLSYTWRHDKFRSLYQEHRSSVYAQPKALDANEVTRKMAAGLLAEALVNANKASKVISEDGTTELESAFQRKYGIELRTNTRANLLQQVNLSTHLASQSGGAVVRALFLYSAENAMNSEYALTQRTPVLPGTPLMKLKP